jgi:integrase/recombinase XerC
MGTQTIVRTGALDPLALALEAIEQDPGLKSSTKDQYTKAVTNAAEAGVDLTDPTALNAYARDVGSSTRAFLSAVIAKMTRRLEDQVKSKATPDNVAAVTATVYRAEALRDAVTVEQTQGHKAHTWLSQMEVKLLVAACGTRKSGEPEAPIVARRDRLAIGLLVAAGLRRSEAVGLTFEDVKRQPVKGRMRTVLDVEGKGSKNRPVPISDKLAAMIGDWGDVVGSEGRVLRSLGRDKVPGDSLSTTAVYHLVQKRGALIGRPDLEPHDLRRTYAQLGYEAGVPLTQISKLLGHASVKTTQRYLNLDLDLETTASDFIPL